MTTYTTAFVGCKVSQADCEAAASRLAAAGLEPAQGDEADVALVMSCCVTAEAERKSRRLAHRFARRGARVVVAGCASRLRPEQFRFPGVTPLDEPSADGALARARTGYEHGGGEGEPAPRRTRLVLKIQDGCSQTCSYCAVRLVRGAPVSLPLTDALEQARRGVTNGCGEVVLTGVDLGAYRDVASGADLAEAVAALCALPGLRRVRLSSLEPGHLTPRLVDALAHERVARHLHVPLQSADDRVLADMARPDAFADYLRLIVRAREALGDVAVSTDVIVGYPTEGEEAFAHTLAAIDGRGGPGGGVGLFERVHVFPYSRRPGTPAEALDELDPAVVKERVGRALGVARDAQRAAHRRRLGQTAEVLLEERRDGLWRGYSSHYVRYYLEGDGARGELVSAVGDEAFADGLKGRIV